MKAIGDTSIPNRPCFICTEKDSSQFGGRSLVKTSCSKSHQLHLRCIIEQLLKQSVPLDQRYCCDSDQPALPLLRDSQLLVQNACQKGDLEALELVGQMLELNDVTQIDTMNAGADIALDFLIAKAYLLMRNFQDNVLKAIKNLLPQNSDSGQESDALRKMSDATRKASTLIESELKKLAKMDMVIVVGGMVNAGKSTTINAIVGFELLPEKKHPDDASPYTDSP